MTSTYKTLGIKILFFAALLSQPLQYMFTARFGEPYPALMMPSFAGTLADKDGNINLTDVRCEILFRDGQRSQLSADDLLPPVPISHSHPIMGYMFDPPSATAATLPPNGLKARLMPGWAMSHFRRGQMELDPQTKDWLKHRLHDIYSQREPEKITFIWYQDVFRANQVPPSVTERPLGVREVSF